ncbi:hypothetical protein AVEN_102252-1 [Araneus ventricosus]|uniref:Ras-GEF domain-containing protein n=1 Tax=Araneus ventricosus TaxID=182803 RepID=A0A4Y2LAF3_ARAVE|nr:hypothetical protein AVEN_102252-1 [Araneus ventricosus]
MASKMWYFLKRKFNPVPRIQIPVAAFFMDVSPKIYAEQLTIVDAEIFERICLAELLYPPFGPVVDESIARFNHVKMMCFGKLSYSTTKKNWSLVSENQKQTYDYLFQLLSWEDNFRNLRDHMSAVKGPRVPYLGLYMNDIIGIYADHPPNEINNGVRMAKMEKIIKSVLVYQGSNYSHIRIWPNIQYLLETYQLSKKELLDMEKFNQ